MSEAGNMDQVASPVSMSEMTLLLLCPVCGAETGEPIGIIGKPARSLEGGVAIRCAGCATIYVSPYRPDAVDALNQIEESHKRVALLHQSIVGLPEHSRILCDDPASASSLAARGNGWLVDTSDGSRTEPEGGKASYDLVLLSRSLRSGEPPGRTMARAAAALKPGGRIVVVIDNVGSSCFELFGGRHWSGYDFPRSRQCLSAAALRQLADGAGLAVQAISTRFSSDAWIESLRNWLQDWGVRRSLAMILAGDWLVPRGVLSLFEWVAVARGKGALLVVEMEKE